MTAAADRDDRPQNDDFARLDGKVASLTAALLARKGQAAPSLKRFAAPKSARANQSSAKAPTEGASCPESVRKECPLRSASAGAKRVKVTLRLTVREFLRLKLGCAELGQTTQAVLSAALSRHLDDKGVERLEDCACLDETMNARI